MTVGKSRIAVVSLGSLFSSGVASLLSRRHDVELLRADAGAQHVYDRVWTSQPNVIVLELRPDHSDGVAVERLFEVAPRALVISLRLQPEGLAVFRTEWIAHATQDDLLRFIEDAGRANEAGIGRGPQAV